MEVLKLCIYLYDIELLNWGIGKKHGFPLPWHESKGGTFCGPIKIKVHLHSVPGGL